MFWFRPAFWWRDLRFVPNNLVTFFVKISEIAMATLTNMHFLLVESQVFLVNIGWTWSFSKFWKFTQIYFDNSFCFICNVWKIVHGIKSDSISKRAKIICFSNFLYSLWTYLCFNPNYAKKYQFSFFSKFLKVFSSSLDFLQLT